MNTNSEIQVFTYENNNVRTVERDGEVWFVAKDVCDILELTNAREALKSLDDDEKSSVRISDGTSPKGGNPNVNIISESGLYGLIMRSNKPEAKKFSRWVRHEVLPQIIKNGTYSIPQVEPLHVTEIRQLCSEQRKIKQRIEFFASIKASYAGFEDILFKLATGRSYYDWPEYTRDDRKDLAHLQNILRLAKDFTQEKISTLESKLHTLETLAKF